MRNCPVCGAENEQEARFCAECGAPLDIEDDDATIVGRVRVVPGPEDDEAGDQTMVSNFFRDLEESETMTIDQAEVAARAEAGPEEVPPPPPVTAEAEIPPVSESSPPPRPVTERPEPEVPLSTGGPGAGGPAGFGAGGFGRGQRNMPLIIGVVVAILLLCCCCCSIAIGSSIASDPTLMEDLFGEVYHSLNYLLV